MIRKSFNMIEKPCFRAVNALWSWMQAEEYKCKERIKPNSTGHPNPVHWAD